MKEAKFWQSVFGQSYIKKIDQGALNMQADTVKAQLAKYSAGNSDLHMIDPDLEIGLWQGESLQQKIALIHQELEVPNWAPWLAASAETMASRAEVFPSGQLVMITGEGLPVASLSLNRIQWDGDPKNLPTWDEVAGDPTDYSQTLVPWGNTLVLMSMNIHPNMKGKHLPSFMVEAAKLVAKQLGCEHLIGSFRPSGYGAWKAANGLDVDFAEYVYLKKTHSEKPIDPWLGSLWHMGMKMLAVDHNAMTVPVSIEEFDAYKAGWKPNQWKEVAPGIWECGEVGNWMVDEVAATATYQESNVWGVIPL